MIKKNFISALENLATSSESIDDIWLKNLLSCNDSVNASRESNSDTSTPQAQNLTGNKYVYLNISIIFLELNEST